MKNLKELLEGYLNDALNPLEHKQLHKAFDESVEFQNFRNDMAVRAARLRKRRLQNRFIWIAALGIALSAGWFAFKNSKGIEVGKPVIRRDVAMVEAAMTSDDYLEKAYRQTLTNVRKDAKTGDSDWKSAYNEGNFAEAIRLTEPEKIKIPSTEINYYRAISFIRLNQFEKALWPLKQISNSDPQQLKTYTPEARWLLANVCLKTKRTTEALLLLNQFIREDAPHAQEAKILLQNTVQ